MPGQRHSQSTPTSLGQGMYACLGVTCHLHFWQNDCSLLHATAVIQGGTDTKYESARTVNSGEENSPTTSARIETCNLSTKSLAFYQQAVLAPKIKEIKEKGSQQRVARFGHCQG